MQCYGSADRAQRGLDSPVPLTTAQDVNRLSLSIARQFSELIFEEGEPILESLLFVYAVGSNPAGPTS